MAVSGQEEVSSPDSSQEQLSKSDGNWRASLFWLKREHSGCSFDANGQGKCIAADCAGRGLECGEQIMGDGNLAEMNLNDKGQGTDWYNLSNVLVCSRSFQTLPYRL